MKTHNVFDRINKVISEGMGMTVKKPEQTLTEIYNHAEEIAGQWDGDESGIREDRAMIANDIMEAVKNLRELLSDLNQ